MKQNNCPSISYSNRTDKEKEMLNQFLVKNKIQFRPIHNPHKDYEAIVQILIANQQESFSKGNYDERESKNRESNKNYNVHKNVFQSSDIKKENSNQELVKQRSKSNFQQAKEIPEKETCSQIAENKNIDKETFEKLLTLISMNKNPKSYSNNKSQASKENFYKKNDFEGENREINNNNLGKINSEENSEEKTKLTFSKGSIPLVKRENQCNQTQITDLEKGKDNNKTQKTKQLNNNQNMNEDNIEQLISQNLMRISFEKFSLLDQNESLPYFGEDPNQIENEIVISKHENNSSSLQQQEHKPFSLKTHFVDQGPNKDQDKSNFDSLDSFDVEEFQRLQIQFDQKTSEIMEEPFISAFKTESEAKDRHNDNSAQQKDLAFLLDSLSSKIVQTMSSSLPTQDNEEFINTYSQLPIKKESMIRSKSSQTIQKHDFKINTQNFNKNIDRNKNSNKKEISTLKEPIIQTDQKKAKKVSISQSKSTVNLNCQNENQSTAKIRKTASKQTSEIKPNSRTQVSPNQKSARQVDQNNQKFHKSPLFSKNKAKILSEPTGCMSSIDAVKHYQQLVKIATFVPFPNPRLEPKKTK